MRAPEPSLDGPSLPDVQDAVVPVLRRHNVREAIVFGSIAKGVATPWSDLDLLVDTDLKGLDFVGFIEDICEAVHRDADVIDVRQVRPGSRVDREIAAAGVLIYRNGRSVPTIDTRLLVSEAQKRRARSKKNKLVLQTLHDRAEKTVRRCQGISEEDFLADQERAEACAFNLLQMGELCAKTDPEFISSHPKIPWRKLKNVRGQIVTASVGLDAGRVWDFIQSDLPPLIKTLASIDNELSAEKWLGSSDR